MTTASEHRGPPVPGALDCAPPFRPHPTKLFVEVTTRCNLRCAMCVKESAGQQLREGHMAPETFARLADAFPRVEALVLNGIGEPLLHPQLEGFIQAAKQVMPPAGWVGFQTNGQLLGPKRAAALVAAGIDRICISADAVSPELFRTLRRGGHQHVIERAAASLHHAARERRRPIALGVEFVAMRDNLRQLPDLVRWASRNRFGFVIVTHMLPYAEETRRAAAFDPSTDRARQLYESWSDRAAAEGVDLGRYFDVFMRFQPAPADERVIAFVKAMVAQAAAQGMYLSLERLLRADRPLRERVEDAFAEAKEIARAEGLDLRLPTVAPSHDRRCDFVEEGGAFVSWDGGVHPCYFLWHGYSVHVAGIVKRVAPRAFGNVAARDLLALWNDASFRHFRREVVGYEFPHCYDCSLALCDGIQGGGANEDCHLGTVPCAACLWCTGVFRCLQ